MRLIVFLLASAALAAEAGGEYRLTARPWRPSNTQPVQYLDAIEGVCRFTARHQNAAGVVIDPFLKREHQYATPYFAYAVGTLIEAGRAPDLLPFGASAMEHSTACFGGGRKAVPDEHGEFFIAALTGALELYKGRVPPDQWNRWRERLKKPSSQVVRGGKNNWETYVMKGDWMRVRAGLISRADAIAVIEDAWNERQSKRIAAAPWFLYHDRTSNPDTLSVEAVGRGNLLALAHLGYDGPGGESIRRIAESATRNTLWLQDPSGQVPSNGRTDDHVWVDIGYQLGFEVMAERAWARGDPEQAGQFRRAAVLAFQSAQRWRRSDGAWAGSYYVTKNRFDPGLRVGYQPASQYTNYNGSFMFHLSEAYHSRKTEVQERPTPSEIGGYAFALDEEFASAFANAGGMFVQANLRGQETETHANHWTPLGIVRFARPGWDTRLGPSDGALTATRGVSFAPAFQENGTWVNLADLSKRYRAEWSVQFVHPLLVRCSISYLPKEGQGGPLFRDDLTITPDGVLSEVRQTGGAKLPWGVTWPLLESDGEPLLASYSNRIASVRYPGLKDEQNFIALNGDAALDPRGQTLRSTYGDLRPVRMTTAAPVSRTWIFPRSGSDPTAGQVSKTFKISKDGFHSVLGKVSGTTYIGRTAAGGVGKELDVNGDGKPEILFDERCGFLLQIRNRRIVAIEADRDVRATVSGKAVDLKSHVPFFPRAT